MTGGWAQYLAVFAGSAVLSLLLTPLAIRVAVSRRVLDLPGDHKSHSTPVPYLGGVAVLLSFSVVIGGAALVDSSTRGDTELVKVLAISIGFVPNVQSLLDGASRSSDASEILTLTGRTELWGFVWSKILEAPFLGHGFGAADAVLSREWWGPPDSSVGAHNTWLQSLLMLGVVGTIPFVTFHQVLIRRWFAQPTTLTRLLTPYLLIHGMTEVEIAAHPVMLTISTFVIMAIDARRNLRAAQDT